MTATRLLLLSYCIFLVHHICLAENENGTSATEDRKGLEGAVPQEDLIWKTATACEGQKLYIECPDIYNRIQVQSTFYGRNDTVTCKHPELPNDKICADEDVAVKNIVMDLCEGEAKCEVTATNDFLAQFGTIICPNVYKYLYVKYRCVPKTALPDAPGLSPYDHATSATSTVRTNYAPLQCCYVVPGVGTSQTTTTSVGGTIVRHDHGIQSVEERIVSERPEVEPTHKVTEIVHSRPVQLPLQVQDPAETQPTKIPHVRISLPSVSKVQLNTLIGAGHEIGREMANGGLSQIRSNIWELQKKNVVTRSYLSPRNKTYFVPRTLLTASKGAVKTRTHIAALGSSEKRSNINGLQSRSRKRNTTKPLLPQRNKRSFKSKNKEI